MCVLGLDDRHAGGPGRGRDARQHAALEQQPVRPGAAECVTGVRGVRGYQ